MEGKVLGVPLVILLLVLLIVLPLLAVDITILSGIRGISERLSQVEYVLNVGLDDLNQPEIIDAPIENASDSAIVKEIEEEIEQTQTTDASTEAEELVQE